MSERRTALQRLVRSPTGLLGVVLVAIILLVATFAPFLSPADPFAIDLPNKLLGPSHDHLLGTDQAGRDLTSRIIWGSRQSIFIALSAVLLGSGFGVTLGLLAGYLSGSLLETLILRLFDILFSVPTLVWSIAIIGIVGTGGISVAGLSFGDSALLIGLIGFSFIPALGRVTYVSALVEAKAGYVRAKKAQGAGWAELIFVEILPNAIPPVIIQATLFIGVAIIVEASLSFIGLGVQPPTPSWGTMLADARSYVFSGEWWLPLFPGLAMCLTVIGFNLLGDALRDLLDPRGDTRQTFM